MNLPKLEMKLTLFPDQDTFDQEFVHLFEYKSFDLAYLFEKFFGRDITKEDVDRYRRHSFKDVLRDFEDRDHKTSTDFNLYNHLLNNNLDPRVLIEYLESVFQTDAPNCYNLYQHGKLNVSSELPTEAQAEINRDKYYVYGMKKALDKLHDLPSRSAKAA